MAANNRIRKSLLMGLIFSLSMALTPTRSFALSQAAAGPAETALMQFAQTVANGRELVTGVYVVDRFSFPVVPQPQDNPSYVSTAADTITQFAMVSQYSNIGLLAHNYLAGQSFFELAAGDRIYLVYGTGRVEAFTVTRFLEYQALSPLDPFSDFRTMDGSETISSTDMFNRAYTGTYHLTFQTCIERDGDSSWGRLFVIAEPVVNLNY